MTESLIRILEVRPLCPQENRRRWFTQMRDHLGVLEIGVVGLAVGALVVSVGADFIVDGRLEIVSVNMAGYARPDYGRAFNQDVLRELENRFGVSQWKNISVGAAVTAALAAATEAGIVTRSLIPRLRRSP